MENNRKDKMVTLRLSAVDLYMLNYIFYNNMIMIVKTCSDMIDAMAKKLRDSIRENEKRKNFEDFIILTKNYERIRFEKPFELNNVEIAETKICVGKPYNVLINSEIITEMQESIIANTEYRKPHSSWIIQLSILYTFLPIAKRLRDFNIDEEKNKKSVLDENSKFYMISEVINLLNNEKENAIKINKIKMILEEKC